MWGLCFVGSGLSYAELFQLLSIEMNSEAVRDGHCARTQLLPSGALLETTVKSKL